MADEFDITYEIHVAKNPDGSLRKKQLRVILDLVERAHEEKNETRATPPEPRSGGPQKPGCRNNSTS
jgi:hypothetical protein